jgi:hypothetical protein
MTGPDEDGVLEQFLRGTRITIGALAAGALLFAVVDIVLWSQGRVPTVPGMEVISYLAAGYAALMLVGRSVVMRAASAVARKRLLALPEVTTQKVLEVYGGRTITGAAFLEGAAFFFLMAFLIDGQWWTLAGGLAFAALLAVLHFPTRERVDAWADEQRQALEQEKLGL